MSQAQSTQVTSTGLGEFSLAIGGLAIGTGEFAAMGILPNLAQGIGVDIPTAGHTISAYALGVVVGAPAFALLCARLPRRLLLVMLMAVFALGNLLSATMDSYLPLMAARFVSGLPHGAYFGVAALVAAAIVPHHQRASAVGRVMLGLSVANVIGVPLATWVGQWLGWRSLFVIVGALALITALAVQRFVPQVPVAADAGLRNELTAFKEGQIWLTLLAASIGFGGMFAVYSYITPTLTQVTGLSQGSVPWLLSIFGLGNIAGSLVGGKCADKSLKGTILGAFIWSALALGLFVFAAHALWSTVLLVFFIGCGVAVVPAMQTRLMDVGKKAQTLSAALNHSAFNIANANGAWLGGLAISAGLGWTATGWVGALLAAGGLLVMLLAFALDKPAKD
ncbi:MFS transporter [Gallaecimonas xiamenensis]|uniref:Transport transmembrane protein n=1 Tax=Gallaecimonas xiamenensis 3-C-1 TaxID=745411 RepID=K2JX42_9GAMM|nr:MFS transporter [Gallaecimonas xiamenensis]EKE74874.1 transport transmembrane protein [Gallaecimonas xiamenensis 3-C-1]